MARSIFSRCAVASLLFATTLGSRVSAGELVCDDLSLYPATEAIDYETQIQPLFDLGNCTGCHGGLGGLFLTEGRSFDELVCQPTETFSSPPGSIRVIPRVPDESWLLLRITCDDPDDPSFRMPRGGSSTLTAEERRRVYDWIIQGAYRSNERLFDAGFEALGCE